jgi:hypothetical protein
VANHTPTPWVASSAPDGTGIPGWNVIGADGWPVCSMMDVHATARERNAANAPFLVRAANAHEALVEACKVALGRLEPFTKMRRPDMVIEVKQMRAALALAEEAKDVSR